MYILFREFLEFCKYHRQTKKTHTPYKAKINYLLITDLQWNRQPQPTLQKATTPSNGVRFPLYLNNSEKPTNYIGKPQAKTGESSSLKLHRHIHSPPQCTRNNTTSHTHSKAKN